MFTWLVHKACSQGVFTRLFTSLFTNLVHKACSQSLFTTLFTIFFNKACLQSLITRLAKLIGCANQKLSALIGGQMLRHIGGQMLCLFYHWGAKVLFFSLIFVFLSWSLGNKSIPSPAGTDNECCFCLVHKTDSA